MDKTTEKDVDSYEYYSCDEHAGTVTASDIDEAVNEWYENLTEGEANDLPGEIDVFCYNPKQLDYDEVTRDYIDIIEESINESYMGEAYPPFEFSIESEERISLAIRKALDDDSFSPGLLDLEATIQVNPKDYL